MSKFHALTVKEVRRETPDCVSVALEVPDELKETFKFTQGQYLTLRTPINEEDVRRSYSICSSPLDQEWRVAIKKVEGGRFSTFANEQLQPGETLEAMPPMGNFHTPLHPSQSKNYIAFAAGSGITPILSILKSVLQIEPHSSFTLFYGNRGVEHIIFREELEALKNKFIDRLSIHYLLSREHPGSELFYGRIDADKCQRFCETLIDLEEADEFFLCGPEAMINAVKNTLESHGIPRKKIHFELFTSPLGPLGLSSNTAKKERTNVQSVVTIIADGQSLQLQLDDPNITILDAALKAGADLPFACKGGVCCTCKAKVLEGKVEMEVNYALEPEEVEAGFVLTCQSHPQTKTVTVDFDV